MSQLAKLQGIIRQHGEGLDAHAEAVERHEHSLHDLEKGMAAYQREGAGAEHQEAMVKNHRQQVQKLTAILAVWWKECQRRYGSRGKGKYGNAVCWRPVPGDQLQCVDERRHTNSIGRRAGRSRRLW